MPACELCGAVGQLYKTRIEGTELSVCHACSGLGTVIAPISFAPKKEKRKAFAPAPEHSSSVHVLVGDFSKRIKACRERLRLSQQEFAARLQERESLVQHLENGSLRPSVELARKLERLLGIVLIEKIDSPQTNAKTPSSKGGEDLTLGDIIVLRKR